MPQRNHFYAELLTRALIEKLEKPFLIDIFKGNSRRVMGSARLNRLVFSDVFLYSVTDKGITEMMFIV